MGDEERRRWDPADVLIAFSRRIEGAGLAMRKHRVVLAQQVCVCGRLATRLIPMFGLRCDIAGEEWDHAQAAMGKLLVQMREADSTGCRAVGRSRVGGVDRG